MPQISVIVPVYKVEKYIHRCVDSILGQTFRDFELILVDDGSPDNCGTICDEYAAKDNRIVVIHQQNGGLSAARNAGIDWAFANSDSQWLTFVDSDDFIKPVFLEHLYSVVMSGNADIATCGMTHFTEENGSCIHDDAIVKHGVYSGKEACIHLYSMDGMISIEAWAKLYKKELFAGIRFPVGKIHEDQAIVPILLYSSNKVAVNTDPLYCYYVREESIMRQNFSSKRFDDIDALDGCISFFYEHDEKVIAELAVHRREFLLGLYTLYAHKAKVKGTIPKRFTISLISAIKRMEQRATFDQVTWYLAKIYPNWVTPYSYWCKIRKMLGVRISE